MAETELTKKIKAACHMFKPQLTTKMRTIRYADEVLCPNGGYVDSIRFEDYVAQDESYCLLEHPERCTDGDRILIESRKCDLSYPNSVSVIFDPLRPLNIFWKLFRYHQSVPCIKYFPKLVLS